MRLAVLLGNPVAHSRSPAMFNAAFKAKKIDAVYVPWQLGAGDLQAALQTLRATGAIGANVTVPHKQAVLPYLDELTPLAKHIGAVNCITVQEGRLVGDNTDTYGFSKCVSRRKGRALILGAGGAARAVITALPGYSIDVCNRHEERRAALQRDFTVNVYGWNALDELLGEADLVVHATSAEVNHEPIALDFSRMRKGAAFIDLTYGDTPLVQRAKQLRIKAMDGSQMLLHQAARAFTLWTGKPPPLDVMRVQLGQS